MKSTKVTKIMLISGLLIGLTSCKFMEDGGTTESSAGSPVNTPADFTVVPGQGSNTPPPEEVPPPPAEPSPDVMRLEGIFLIDAEPRTSAASVVVELVTFSRNLMRIGSKTDCSDGTWEPWQPTKLVQLTQLNQTVTISAQFHDWDGRTTPCYSKSFIHDNRGPDILFQRYPTVSLEEGAATSLAIQVTDTLSAVTEVKCSLNGLERSCIAGSSEVNITAMPEGSYQFTVTAKDELGNQSQQSVSWTVVSSVRLLSQNIRVNDYKKVDILFVIDNSGSMAYEQRNMGQRTANFLSVLRGLDWQIGITTTDPRDISLGDGRLIPLTGVSGQYLINSTLPEATAQDRLSRTLQRPETGSGVEQGIRAAYRAIERYISGETNPRSFFRDGAQFAVVLISDEDESDNTAKNNPQNLVNLVNTTFGGQKMFSYHSIITRPGDQACISTDGASFGERYKIMSDLTGGLIGDVCQRDYAAQVQGIAEGIRSLLKTLTLQCAPLVERGIVIKKDGVTISSAYHVEGVNLRFDTELDPGNYTVDYRCLR